MKTSLTATALLLFTLHSFPSAEAYAKGEPGVLAKMTEGVGFGGMRNSGLPTVILYSDGTVLFVKPLNKKDEIYEGKLSPEEFESVKKALGPTDDFRSLKKSYNLWPNVFDLPNVEITLTDGKKRKSVDVYGWSGDGKTFDGPHATGPKPSKKKPDTLPAEFERLYKLLNRLEPKNSKPWVPKYLEVHIWPFEYSAEEPIPWPDGWPTQKDRLAFADGDDGYTLILTADKLPMLKEIGDRTGATRAVLIDNKKWAIMYRPVVPGLDMWRKIMMKQVAKKL